MLNAVSKVCSVVPGQYRSVCDEYIKDYGPGVVSILVDDFVPDKVCATLGVCRNTMISYPPRKVRISLITFVHVPCWLKLKRIAQHRSWHYSFFTEGCGNVVFEM